MGFFGNIIGSALKVALTPVSVAKDTLNVLEGKKVNSTKKLLNSATKDIKKSIDDLGNLDII